MDDATRQKFENGTWQWDDLKAMSEEQREFFLKNLPGCRQDGKPSPCEPGLFDGAAEAPEDPEYDIYAMHKRGERLYPKDCEIVIEASPLCEEPIKE